MVELAAANPVTILLLRDLRAMCDAAWQWCRERNLIRINEIHREEEARLILNDEFQMIDESGQEVNMSGSMEVEEPCMHDRVIDCVLAWFLLVTRFRSYASIDSTGLSSISIRIYPNYRTAAATNPG